MDNQLTKKATNHRTSPPRQKQSPPSKSSFPHRNNKVSSTNAADHFFVISVCSAVSAQERGLNYGESFQTLTTETVFSDKGALARLCNPCISSWEKLGRTGLSKAWLCNKQSFASMNGFLSGTSSSLVSECICFGLFLLLGFRRSNPGSGLILLGSTPIFGFISHN